MANTNSAAITEFVAKPATFPDVGTHGARIRTLVETSALAAQSANDTHMMVRIPVDAYIPSIKFASDDLGTTGTVDIGFYQAATNSGVGAVVDADAIANDIDVNSAAVALTEYRFSAKGIETATQKAWELAGLSAKPKYGFFDIGLTFDAATTAAGDVTLIVEYCVD